MASAKANVAKIKIKALLVLMRKIISESGGSSSFRQDSSSDDPDGDIGNLIENKLSNIAKMIPQYNASLDEVTKLAKEATDVSSRNGIANQYNNILVRLS